VRRFFLARGDGSRVRSWLRRLAATAALIVIVHHGFYWVRGKQFALRIESLRQRELAWRAFTAGRAEAAERRLQVCRDFLNSPTCGLELSNLSIRLGLAARCRSLYGLLPASSGRSDVLLDCYALDADRQFFDVEHKRLSQELENVEGRYRSAVAKLLSSPPDRDAAREELEALAKEDFYVGAVAALLREVTASKHHAAGNATVPTPYLDALHQRGADSFVRETLIAERNDLGRHPEIDQQLRMRYRPE
jgi:hypothetical protein